MNDIVELPVDPVGDPGGRRLAAAIRAHFELEKATCQRRGWTAALALASIPAVVGIAFPSLFSARLRALELVAWLGCATAWGATIVAEVRWRRFVQRSVAAARAEMR
jgi:hypothetical protein